MYVANFFNIFFIPLHVLPSPYQCHVIHQSFLVVDGDDDGDLDVYGHASVTILFVVDVVLVVDDDDFDDE